MPNVKRTSSITPDRIVAARGTTSQRDAAELLGVSRATMQNYERGERAMRESDFEMLLKLIENKSCKAQ